MQLFTAMIPTIFPASGILEQNRHIQIKWVSTMRQPGLRPMAEMDLQRFCLKTKCVREEKKFCSAKALNLFPRALTGILLYKFC